MKKYVLLMGLIVTVISAKAQTYSTGVITDNTFLTLIGPTNAELYGVNFAGNAETTANGYTFSADPLNGGSVPVIYANGANAQVSSFLTQSGGTSGDPALDVVLTDGQVPGPTPENLIVGGLTQGVMYNLLIFAADTRAGVNQDRSISITHNSLLSPSQVYAFQGGAGGVGGYILDTFTASGSEETIQNNQVNGAQINGMIIALASASPAGPTLAIAQSGSNVTLTLTGTPSTSYRLLASTDVTVPVASWQQIVFNTLDGSGVWQFTNMINQSAQFYRAVTP